MFLIVHRSTSGHRGELDLVISPPGLHVNSAPTGPPGKFVCAIDRERERERERRGGVVVVVREPRE